MKSKKKLSILVPVRNESANITISLTLLDVLIDFPHEVLVIYDDPSDNTIPIVKKIHRKFDDVKLVYNDLGVGIPNALQKGIDTAIGDYIVIIAADDIGLVPALKDMLVLMDEGCDLVSATRYAHGGRRYGGSFFGRMLSKLGNRLFKVLSGTVFTDSTTGGKMFRKSIFKKIQLESRQVGWAVVFELAIKSQVAKLKLGEVPIISIDRLYGGQSTFSLGPWFKAYLRWFFYGIKELHLKKKPKLNLRIPKNIKVKKWI